MMVVTAKVKKRNILIFAAALIAILAILFLPNKKAEDTLTQEVAQKAATNEQRVAFLQNLGIEVNEAPVETQDVVIPAEENEIFQRYNELQRSQGYDLNQHAGKTVKRYVYEITNYPDTSSKYHATLLIYKDNIIGGDVASDAANGVMHALQLPA